MKNLPNIIKLLRNKYLLSFIAFTVWVSFFDRNDMVTQWDRKQELNRLQTSASFYEKEIAVTRKDLTDLNTNPATLEKFAREKFYLKKPGEQIFIITDSANEKNMISIQ